MSSAINTNVASLNAQRNLNSSQASLQTSLQRLSSGLRVNSAKDDAAGLAISVRMGAQVRGMNVAIRNSNDAISYAQTAEGALGKATDSLQRMRELAVQSVNATNGTADRANLDTEFKQLQAEVTRLTGQTSFNGNKVLTGTSQTYQVGANTTDTITVAATDLTAASSKTALAALGRTVDVPGTPAVAAVTAVTAVAASDPDGIPGNADDVVGVTGVTGVAGVAAVATTYKGNDILTAANATATMTAIDDALTEINTERATFGAVQNRFESVVSNLEVSVENVSAARSRIIDTDFAQESANLTRGQILQQAGTAMLAQANSLPNSVLSLLKG